MPALFAVMALATACGLPVSGTVEQGLPVDQPEAPPIKVQFEAPRAGASQSEIVRGFLAAHWSTGDNYREARAYLTKKAGQRWRPRSVLVYPTDAAPVTAVSADGSTVTVSVVEVGTLDPEGRFQAAPVNTTREVEIGMSKVAGEWRIGSLPEGFGLWLSKFYFDNAYRSYQVTFVSAGGRRVVPDWRRFEVGASLGTALAKAMLDPIPTYLTGAVTTSFPPATVLAVDAVPVENGVAQVELNEKVMGLDTEARRGAWAQALRTMRQLNSAEGVTLSVEGAPLGVPGVDGTPQRLADVGYAGAPPRSSVVLRRVGDLLTPLSFASFPTEVRSAALPPLPRVPTRWPAAAVSLDLRDVIAVGDNKSAVARWINGHEVDVRAPGRSLTVPSFDHLGRPWIGGVGSDGRTGIWTYPAVNAEGEADGRPARVSVPWLSGRALIDVRPAPEGARAVVLSKSADGTLFVEVAGVERDPEGVPVGLSSALPVARDVADASSVMWISDRVLGIVGTTVSGEPHVPLVTDLNDVSEVRAGADGVQRLVSLGGSSGLAAVNTANQLLRRTGERWQTIGVASDLLMPGG